MQAAQKVEQKIEEKVAGASNGGTSNGRSQFEKGYTLPEQQQARPGLQSQMHPRPVETELPTEDGRLAEYKAAGKLLAMNALITGGDSGIGRSIAVLFAREGANVGIVYTSAEQEDAETTKAVIQRDSGREIQLYPGDVKDSTFAKDVVDSFAAKYGCIDVLVNNAGYQSLVDAIEKLEIEQWDLTFKTNIYPFFYFAKFAVPHMHKVGSIINMTSVNSYKGGASFVDYSSTKGAIVSFTRALSNQLVDRGIRVNAIAPGPIWTPLIASTIPKESLSSFGHNVPMGRPGQPSEVAAPAVFLASSDSSYISGSVLHPNGGTITNS
ncbi:short-chain dehydrogenase/reductase SDR [Lipomyces tetrasporus]